MPFMKKTVLDVGNCTIDHAAIEQMIGKNFQAHVLRALGPEDAIEVLRNTPVDLVLVNRRLHSDYSDGVALIRQIKSDPDLAQTPVMLVSDHSRYQHRAVEAGAEPGFGKSELSSPETPGRLRRFLG